MSIRSVDLQTLYPKVGEAGRTLQARDESVQAAQQQFASQLAGKVEREATQVTQTPESRGSKVGERSGRGSSEQGQDGEQGRQPGEQEGGQEQGKARPGVLPGEPGQRLDLKG